MKTMFGNTVGQSWIVLGWSKELSAVLEMMVFLSCFQWSSGIYWAGALALMEMTEKTKLWGRYGQNFKSSWVVLLSRCRNSAAGRNHRAEVPLPLLLAHVCRPSPVGLFFCLVLIVLSLIWGFVSALKALQTSREQITSEQQERKLKREGGTEAPAFWTLGSRSWLDRWLFLCCFIASPALR